MRTNRKSTARRSRKPAEWDLRLYIAGNTAKSNAALENLRAICEEKLRDKYRIEIVDLLKHPDRASSDQILAIPTLVRRMPTPIRKLIGDLSDRERVLMRLNLYIEGACNVAARQEKLQ